MKKYVLGIDGGNTKADYMLFDTEGNYIDNIREGSCSHEALPGGFPEAKLVMESAIKRLLSPHGLKPEDISGAAMGLAGIDFERQKNEMDAIVSSLGFSNFVVVNDSFLGIKGASTKGFGVCSINGTGTVAGGIDPTGKTLQVGGIGYSFGDEAGGGYIAEMAIRLCYDYFYRCAPKTTLAKKLMDFFEITDKSLFAEKWVYRDTKKIKPLDINRFLFEAAGEGDEPSIDLLKRTGRNMADSAAGCINNLNFGQEVEVILAGSVWIKAETPFIFDSFKKEMKVLTNKECSFIRFEEPPAAGAVLWAIELSEGAFPDEEMGKRIKRQANR